MPRKKGKSGKKKSPKVNKTGGTPKPGKTKRPGKIPSDKKGPSSGKIPGDKQKPEAEKDLIPQEETQEQKPDEAEDILKGDTEEEEPKKPFLPREKEEGDEQAQETEDLVKEPETPAEEEPPEKEPEEITEEEEPSEEEFQQEDTEESAAEEEKSPVEEVKEKIDATWDKIKEIRKKVQDAKDKALDSLPPEVKQLWEENKARLEELDGGIIDNLRQAYEDARDLCADWQAAGNDAGDAVDEAEESFDLALEAFDKGQEAIKTAGGYIEDGTILEKLSEVWGLVQEAKDKGMEAKEKAEEAWQKIQDAHEHCSAEEEEESDEEQAEDGEAAEESEVEESEEEEAEGEPDEEETEDEEQPSEFAVAPNLTNTIVLEGISPGEDEEGEEEIEPDEVRVIEIADVQFRTDSAVPSPLETPAAVGGQIPALQAIRLAYLYAEQNSEHQLLIAGHTDTTASARFNFELSAYRAKAVHALTSGDVEEWREAVSAKNLVEDRQSILKYFHGYEGISSDPGPVDGIEGQRTRNATMGFQRGYNRIFNNEITVDGVWGNQTWGAVFSFYEKLLKDSLGEGRETLAHYRGQLTWYPTRQMCACGESIPQDHPGADEYRSQSNRRVEILFLSEEAEIEFTCCTEEGPFAEEVCDRDTCPLYGLNENQEPVHNFSNITEEGLINTANIKVFLRDVFGKPLSNFGYTIRYLGGEREGRTDDQGMLVEEDVPEGEVRIELENELYADFEDEDSGEQVLDTFGDEERPPSGGEES